MILLDTNVLSELMRLSPNDNVIHILDKTPEKSSFISAITHAEILQGIALLDNGKRKQKLAKLAQQLLALFADRTLAFDKHSAPIYATIIQQRKLARHPIDFPDAQIAAIALQYDLRLLTRNTKDFDYIEGLQLVNPWL